MKAYLTFDEACKELDISRNTFSEWIKEGLPIVEMGPRLKRVRWETLDSWIRENFEKNAGTTSPLMVSGAPGTVLQVVEKVGKIKL